MLHFYILQKPSFETTGHFFIDEEVLLGRRHLGFYKICGQPRSKINDGSLLMRHEGAEDSDQGLISFSCNHECSGCKPVSLIRLVRGNPGSRFIGGVNDGRQMNSQHNNQSKKPPAIVRPIGFVLPIRKAMAAAISAAPVR